MKIILMGHSSVLISSGDTNILFDPYFKKYGNLMYSRINPASDLHKGIKSLDAILLSHEHWDHMDIEFIKKHRTKTSLYYPKGSIKSIFFKGKAVKAGEQFSIKDFKITVVRAHHLCASVGYIVEDDNSSVYFAGDTYYGEFIKEIAHKKIDIAMLPLTKYIPPMTMGKKGVLNSLEDIKPKVYIPIHLDIAPRLQSAFANVNINNFEKVMNNSGLLTKLVYLKNGDSIDTEEIL